MENTSKPTNFATICYHYRDAAFARKIAAQIRHFKLPVKLQKSGKITTNELSSMEELEIGIERHEGEVECPDCRFLVVISSVHAVDENGNSHLNDIIESFIAKNNGAVDGVIPIINRTKNGARATRCLPAAAATRSLLAADVADKGAQRIISDVVSHMLNLNPDDLWNRQLRYQKKRNRILAGIALFATMLLGVIGYKTYDYYTPDFYYYESFVEQNNIPVGLNELDASTCRSRAQYFEFESYRGVIRSVTRRNGHGYVPPDDTEGIHFRYDSRWPHVSRYIYDDNGTLLRCEHFQINGRKIATRTFKGDITELKSHTGQNLSSEETTIAKHLLNNYIIRQGDELFLLNSCIPVSSLKQVRDDKGRVVSALYLNAFGNPIKGANGEWGRRFIYDTEGHLLGYNSLDSVGEVSTNALGFSGERYTYDDAGKITSVSYVDVTGAPAINTEGVHSFKFEYNEQGNLCKACCYDVKGAPAFNIRRYHQLKFSYNEFGDHIKTESLDLAGNIIGCMNISRDELGRISKYYQTTADGRLATPVSCMKYDARDNVVEIRYFTQDGQPATYIGYHYKVSEYNANDQEISKFYFGVRSEPVETESNGHGVRFYYDDRGYVLGYENYNARGELIVRSVHERMLSNGALLSESYYSAEGIPYRFTKYPKRTFKRNEQGFVTEIMNYTFVHPNHVKPSAEFCRYTYNEKGMVETEMTYSGSDSYDKPIYSSTESSVDYGCSGKKHEYDNQGRRIRTMGLSPDFEPDFLAVGCMAREFEYDRFNRIVCTRYTDDKGNLTLSNGVAMMRTEYDAKENITRERCFGIHGEPVHNKDGIHCVETKYTADNKIIEMSFKDSQGNLKCIPAGYAYRKSVFDGAGNIVRTELYDANMRRVR